MNKHMCRYGMAVFLSLAVVFAAQDCRAQAAAAPAAPAVRKAKLLAISTGKLPSDVNAADISLEDSTELKQAALKVVFQKDGYIGEYALKIRDWRPFTKLRFQVLNPDKAIQTLNMTIKHSGTQGYPTRVDQNFMLRPGISSQEVDLVGLSNNDGTAADLSAVKQITIALIKGGTLLFGDFTLETGD